jgi:hypothetical protein
MSVRSELVRMARAECKANGIKLYLGKGKSVQYGRGIRVNGFFDFDVKKPKQPRLACATGRPNWELVLVHELNHVRQWKEDCKVWKDYCDTTGDMIDRAISGRKIDPIKLKKDTFITLLMEHDCERRSHSMLKKLGYPKAKLVQYVQKANAYALFYLYVAKHKKWYSIGKEPYNTKKVWSKFPKTFDIDIASTFAQVGHLFDHCVTPNPSK